MTEDQSNAPRSSEDARAIWRHFCGYTLLGIGAIGAVISTAGVFVAEVCAGLLDKLYDEGGDAH